MGESMVPSVSGEPPEQRFPNAQTNHDGYDEGCLEGPTQTYKRVMTQRTVILRGTYMTTSISAKWMSDWAP